MEMTEARTRLKDIRDRARANWPGKTAGHVEGTCVMLEGLSATATCLELAAAIREVRAAEGWPGSLRSWAWFDDRLFALAEALDCTPAIARPSVALKARTSTVCGPQ